MMKLSLSQRWVYCRIHTLLDGPGVPGVLATVAVLGVLVGVPGVLAIVTVSGILVGVAGVLETVDVPAITHKTINHLLLIQTLQLLPW